jgi:hypothetical protein
MRSGAKHATLNRPQYIRDVRTTITPGGASPTVHATQLKTTTPYPSASPSRGSSRPMGRVAGTPPHDTERARASAHTTNITPGSPYIGVCARSSGYTADTLRHSKSKEKFLRYRAGCGTSLSRRYSKSKGYMHLIEG